jgi:hypothetical protein
MRGLGSWNWGLCSGRKYAWKWILSPFPSNRCRRERSSRTGVVRGCSPAALASTEK